MLRQCTGDTLYSTALKLLFKKAGILDIKVNLTSPRCPVHICTELQEMGGYGIS